MTSSDVARIDLHHRMVRIRLFEEAAGRLAEDGKLPGFLHLYVGQEAVAAGVCAASTMTITSPRHTAVMATSSPRGATSDG